MAKKIGIVTWYHKGYNFGSTLQAYSTQMVLEQMGYDAELINYSSDKRKLKKNIKDFGKKIYLRITKPNVHRAWVKMDKWINSNLNVSGNYDSWEKLKKNAGRYDATICGSDQIWRSHKDGIIDPFYFLQFISEEKRIAYAPSIARDYIDERIVDEFTAYVKEIRHLSIREKQGAELLKKVTGRDAKVVLDPTLLLTKDQWEKQLENKESYKKDYIFCYLLTKNEQYYQEVLEVAKNEKLEVITPAIFSNCYNDSIPLDSFDFLNLIKGAKFVVTDSFHGVAFSISFKKRFAAYKRFPDSYKKSQNSRIYNILDELQIRERLVDNNSLQLILNKEINFQEVDKLLNKMRRDSLRYLEDSLSNI
ncbi:polysaccharide pyruvyl transferase family protein [Brassicibacter mesophilus]|uniref:polysaccharide pyruvyl transferase family protein n=1 Tax=Brassicibacter mesophilus TaxID=745119 RepID=UPI003D2446AA